MAIIFLLFSFPPFFFCKWIRICLNMYLFMPLKKVQFGSKAKAIYPTHYINMYHASLFLMYKTINLDQAYFRVMHLRWVTRFIYKALDNTCITL